MAPDQAQGRRRMPGTHERCSREELEPDQRSSVCEGAGVVPRSNGSSLMPRVPRRCQSSRWMWPVAMPCCCTSHMYCYVGAREPGQRCVWIHGRRRRWSNRAAAGCTCRWRNSLLRLAPKSTSGWRMPLHAPLCRQGAFGRGHGTATTPPVHAGAGTRSRAQPRIPRLSPQCPPPAAACAPPRASSLSTPGACAAPASPAWERPAAPGQACHARSAAGEARGSLVRLSTPPHAHAQRVSQGTQPQQGARRATQLLAGCLPGCPGGTAHLPLQVPVCLFGRHVCQQLLQAAGHARGPLSHAQHPAVPCDKWAAAGRRRPQAATRHWGQGAGPWQCPPAHLLVCVLWLALHYRHLQLWNGGRGHLWYGACVVCV